MYQNQIQPLWDAISCGDLAWVHDALGRDAGLAGAANEQGITALIHAARHGRVEVAELLIARGAEVDAIDHVHKSTALGWAAFYGHFEVVEALLRAGADAAYVNIYNLTPLEIALGGARGEHLQEAPDKAPEDFLAIVETLRHHAGGG